MESTKEPMNDRVQKSEYLNIVSLLNTNYEYYDYEKLFFPIPEKPYIKQHVIRKSKEHVLRAYADWFAMHDEITKFIEPHVKEFQEKFVTKESESKEASIENSLPLVELLEWFSRNESYSKKEMVLCEKASCSSEFFNAYVVNEKDVEMIVNIMGRPFLIPKRSAFLMSDVSRIHLLCKYKPSSGYQMIVADPPWLSKSVSRTTKHETKYETFNEFRLLEIPIPKLADQQGAIVMIWVTNRVAFHKFIMETLFKSWNITFLTKWYWMKITKDGEPVIPLQSKQRKPYEGVIIGYYGDCQTTRFSQVKQLIQGTRILFCAPTKHSQKPPLIPYLSKEISLIIPNANALELFARNLLANCTSWGNETLKFQDLQYFKKRN